MISEVTIPRYLPNDSFHHEIIDFVKVSLNDSKTVSFMGLMEKYAFFCVVYDAPECRFILSVCYENGKTWSRAFDKFEYCEWRDGDTDETVKWNLRDITNDIICNIEGFSSASLLIED
jgi:hypothetical protein